MSFTLYYICVSFFFFFFQAEDGIRDLTVTGVQTCALPIWIRGLGRLVDRAHHPAHRVPEQAVRADELGVGLLLLRAGRATDHEGMRGRRAARRRDAARTRRTMPSHPHSTHQRRSSAETTRSQNRFRIAVISAPQCRQNLPCGSSRYTTTVTIATRIATVASKTTTISMPNPSARPGGQLQHRSRPPAPLALPRPDQLHDTPLQLRHLARRHAPPLPPPP